jgi:hypothetical protein
MMDLAVPANMKVGFHQDEIARRGWAATAQQAIEIVGRQPDVTLIAVGTQRDRAICHCRLISAYRVIVLRRADM